MKLMALVIALGMGFSGAVFAAKNEWPEFNARGTCTYDLEDSNQVQFKFYTQDLKQETDVEGFVLITLQQGKQQEDFGAYRATFTLLKDVSGMTVKVNDDTLEIPFGKNQKVTDSQGKVATCTTSLQGR